MLASAWSQTFEVEIPRQASFGRKQRMVFVINNGLGTSLSDVLLRGCIFSNQVLPKDHCWLAILLACGVSFVRGWFVSGLNLLSAIPEREQIAKWKIHSLERTNHFLKFEQVVLR